MNIKSLATKIALATTVTAMTVGEAFARHGHGHGRHHAPEIDGPAGLAAVALIAGAGMMIYNRYKK